MDKNDIKTFVIGAVSGALSAFILSNSGLNLNPIQESSIQAALSNVQFSLPAGIEGPQGPEGVGSILLTQNFNSRIQSNSNQSATIGPLSQSSPYYNFDSTLMGPEYGTKRETNQNIIMGYHSNSSISSINNNRIAIGNQAGNIGQEQEAIAIGINAGNTTQGKNSIAIGKNAGKTNQVTNSIAIAPSAGEIDQKENSVAIGFVSGTKKQEIGAVAIGRESGGNEQKSFSVSIGREAGADYQEDVSVAIGYQSGKTRQGHRAIAIGTGAGSNYQGKYSVAIGSGAGRNNQVLKSICLGTESSIEKIDEDTSKNKITMCITARDSGDNDSGGASNQHSFVYSNSNYLFADILDDGLIGANTAGDLATNYLKNANAVGFLNIKVNRGARKFVGFAPVLNIKLLPSN